MRNKPLSRFFVGHAAILAAVSSRCDLARSQPLLIETVEQIASTLPTMTDARQQARGATIALWGVSEGASIAIETVQAN